MTQLLSVAITLAAGLMMTRVFKLLKLNFPDVTAFLIAGLAIGPYCLGKLGISGIGFTTMEEVEGVGIISKVALGFIAFAIGNEFRLSALKKTGKQATVVGIVQGLIAALLVDAVLVLTHFLFPDVISVPAAITLGSIATATAPAATLMVVRQYKAKGPLTDLLLPVVALDDAVGLMVFAISFGIARAMLGGKLDFITIIVNPLIEIAASLALGALLGVFLTYIEKLFYSNSNRLSMTIMFVLMTVALSSFEFHIGEVRIGFSSLLVCMMLGTLFCNMCPFSEDIMGRADRWTAPIYALFFVISGAELELSVFSKISVVLIGVVYIIFRSCGKYIGAYGSCKATSCDPSTTKYLGVTLLPQAGVALGMCTTASALGQYNGMLIRNIILFSVLIYELIGPMLTKWALTKAGDIKPASEDKKSRDRFASNRKAV